MSTIETLRIDWEAVKRRMPELQAAMERSNPISEARLHEIRCERAVRLAARQAKSRASTDAVPLIVFRLGNETYGIELKYVARVFPQTIVTPLSDASPTLLGIANLQGEVRSVLDLRRLLHLPETKVADDGYVLLLRGNGGCVGLQVERIDELRHFSPDRLTAPDDDANERCLRFVRGVTPDKVIVLDVGALVDPAAASAEPPSTQSHDNR